MMNTRHIYEENKHAEVWLQSLLDEYKILIRSYERMNHKQAWEEAGYLDARNKAYALSHTLNIIRREITAYETTVINQN